jgi:hypothetical protein
MAAARGVRTRASKRDLGIRMLLTVGMFPVTHLDIVGGNYKLFVIYRSPPSKRYTSRCYPLLWSPGCRVSSHRALQRIPPSPQFCLNACVWFFHCVQLLSSGLPAWICHKTMSAPHTRLKKLLSGLSPSTPGSPQTIGTLELGGISYEVPASLDPTRLPHCNTSAYLDVRDGFNYDGLHFMLQKFLLGQDVFLLSQPGPYARRLAMTFCRCVEIPAKRFLWTDLVQHDQFRVRIYRVASGRR